jgi:hypothetical protein
LTTRAGIIGATLPTSARDHDRDRDRDRDHDHDHDRDRDRDRARAIDATETNRIRRENCVKQRQR